jgi:hypothetical protein
MLHLHGYYRLLKATVAVERTENEKQGFQVPAEAILLVNSFERQGPLVEVIYAGRLLLMFEIDLVVRTQPLEGHRLFNGSRGTWQRAVTGHPVAAVSRTS